MVGHIESFIPLGGPAGEKVQFVAYIPILYSIKIYLYIIYVKDYIINYNNLTQ